MAKAAQAAAERAQMPVAQAIQLRNSISLRVRTIWDFIKKKYPHAKWIKWLRESEMPFECDKFGLPKKQAGIKQARRIYKLRAYLQRLSVQKRNLILTGDPAFAFDPVLYELIFNAPQAIPPDIAIHFPHLLPEPAAAPDIDPVAAAAPPDIEPVAPGAVGPPPPAVAFPIRPPKPFAPKKDPGLGRKVVQGFRGILDKFVLKDPATPPTPPATSPRTPTSGRGRARRTPATPVTPATPEAPEVRPIPFELPPTPDVRRSRRNRHYSPEFGLLPEQKRKRTRAKSAHPPKWR
jgi:hypothetical protein